jgi:SulP family sulfate permease
VVRERVPADPPYGGAIVYDLEGEAFFGSAPELDRCCNDLKRRTG